MKNKLNKNIFSIGAKFIGTYGLGVAILLSSTSCSDDFLNEKNPNGIDVTEFWQNIEDLDSGLNAVYGSLKDPNLMNVIVESKRSDIAFGSWDKPVPLSRTGEVEYNQIHDLSSPSGANRWAALYEGIFRANQVIVNYEKLKEKFTTDAQLKRAPILLAEARALRAYFYFSLHNVYNEGRVPIVTNVPVDARKLQVPSSESAQVLNFYRNELIEARESLNTISELREGNGKTGEAGIDAEGDIGRITQEAVTAILGKSYMFNGEYIQAQTEFEKLIIGHPTLKLMDNIGSNFTTKDEFNDESIFEINYTTVVGLDLQTADERHSNSIARSLDQFFGSFPQSWLHLLYSGNDSDGLEKPDPLNIKNIREDGTVMTYSERARESVAIPGDDDSDYYGKKSSEKNFNRFNRNMFWKKHLNHDINFGTEDRSALFVGKSGINERIIRLADIYLLYAEIKITMGDVPGALEYINKVRRRAGVRLLGDDTQLSAEHLALVTAGEATQITEFSSQPINATNLMEHLQNVERPLELAFEGNSIRNIDLRRWGITHKRFKELARRRYAVGGVVAGKKLFNVEYIGSDNNLYPEVPFDKYETIIPEGTSSDKRLYDSENAAKNFGIFSNDYLPIPLDEINANPGAK